MRTKHLRNMKLALVTLTAALCFTSWKLSQTSASLSHVSAQVDDANAQIDDANSQISDLQDDLDKQKRDSEDEISQIREDQEDNAAVLSDRTAAGYTDTTSENDESDNSSFAETPAPLSTAAGETTEQSPEPTDFTSFTSTPTSPQYDPGYSQVNGYLRANGTYVQPYNRTNPDGNFYNNWSTKGNINPFTGKEGTRVHPRTR